MYFCKSVLSCAEGSYNIFGIPMQFMNIEPNHTSQRTPNSLAIVSKQLAF